MNSSYQGVMTFVEKDHDTVQSVSYEILGKATELAQKVNEPVIAVVLGDKITKEMTDELIARGADKVIAAEHPLLATFLNSSYAKVLTDIIAEEKPSIVILGATSIGRDLAPRVSARLTTGLTADCTSLEIDEETQNLLMTRPAFGGNIMATIICPDNRPQMTTVRPGVMVKLAKDTTRTGTVVHFDVKLEADPNVEILEEVKEKKTAQKIEDAKVLVSAGRGIGSQKNLEPLYELASQLKGTVSGSRAVVDAGYLDKDYQVGQTGKTVRPGLYFACGISGAIQHLAGMEESEFIVAINKDPEAPIFQTADVSIVGDVNQIVPLVLEKLSK